MRYPFQKPQGVQEEQAGESSEQKNNTWLGVTINNPPPH